MAQVSMNTPPAVHRTINEQMEQKFIENVNFVCTQIEKILAFKKYWEEVLHPRPAKTYDELQKYLDDCDTLFTHMAAVYETLLPYEKMAHDLYPELWHSPLIRALREHYLALKERESNE